MSTRADCNREISNFMNEMIQSLEEKKYSNSTPQQMFIQHLAKYNKQLQEEWRNQLSQGLFRDPRHLAGKLEAATRLNRLAENLPEQGLSSNSDELRNWFINNKDLELKNEMDNPHRDKVIEYQYMKNQYHAVEEELNRRQKWFDYTKEGLTNLNKMNNSFHRPFMNSQKLIEMGKGLNNIVNSLGVKINPSVIEKLNKGERLSKDAYHDLKQLITGEMKDLEKELINAKNRVEQIKEKAYNAYTRGSVFQKIFSSDRHITEKLDEMIQKEIRQAGKYERKWAQQPDQNRIATPENNQEAASVAPQVQSVPVPQVAQTDIQESTATESVNLENPPQQEVQQQQAAQIQPAPLSDQTPDPEKQRSVVDRLNLEIGNPTVPPDQRSVVGRLNLEIGNPVSFLPPNLRENEVIVNNVNTWYQETTKLWNLDTESKQAVEQTIENLTSGGSNQQPVLQTTPQPDLVSEQQQVPMEKANQPKISAGKQQRNQSQKNPKSKPYQNQKKNYLKKAHRSSRQYSAKNNNQKRYQSTSKSESLIIDHRSGDFRSR
jgi:hypothetical protein